MTALNSYLSPNAVVVMTDTLMTNETGHPVGFVAKTYAVPQINALISGRGDSGLIVGFAFDAMARMLVSDFDMLVDLAPDLLKARWASIEGNRTGTASVFLWGWSTVVGRFSGVVLRSGENFEPEILQDGTRFAPGLEDESRMAEVTAGDNPVASMLQVMRLAAEESRATPEKPDRCHIGGEVVVYTMMVDDSGHVVTTSEIVHYFADRDEQYAQALTLLDG